MAASIHSIRLQRFEVGVATEALALTLQPQLGELNRGRLLPVIERVLDELDAADRHISLDRVSVDLGVLPMETLAESAEAALYEALHRALRSLLADGASVDASTAHRRSEESGRIGALAEYLLHGVLPFWAASADVTRATFSAQDLVLHLFASEPTKLAALLRRIGHVPHALERLVLQLDETALAAILRLLEPAHAALILAYMLDLREIHRDDPLVGTDDAGFRRLLWLLTFTYLMREPGSQFNRKSFVLALLGGVAEREGIRCAELILALGRGLQTTAWRLPLVSSLPAIIAELAQQLAGEELEAEPSPSSGADVQSEFWTQSSAFPLPPGPAEMAALVRLRGSDRGWLESFVAQLDERSLEAVLRLLESSHAAVILGYLAELTALHRSEPVLPLAQQRFERLLWVLTFTYLARDAGSQFNRRSFLSSLLLGAARAEGVAYETLVTTFARGLDAVAHRLPVDTSLPAIVANIVREIGAGQVVAAEFSSEPNAASAAAALETYIRCDALVHFLRRGYWPAGFLLAHGPLSPAELAAELMRLSLPRLRAFVRVSSSKEREEMLLRLVRALPPDVFTALLHRWLPAAADAGNPLNTALKEFGEQAADRDVFNARLLASIIDETTIDVEALAAHWDVSITIAAEELHEWSAARLASAVAALARGDAPHGPGLRTLLQEFVTQHVAEAKAFLRAALAQPQGEALLAAISAEDDDHLLALADPAAAQVFGVLLAALQGLPLADRMPRHVVRRVILEAALRAKPEAHTLQDEIRRVFGSLFGSPVPSAVRQHLLSALEKTVPPDVSHTDLISALSETGKSPTSESTRGAEVRDLLLDWLRNPDIDLPFAFDLSSDAFAEVFATYAAEVRRVLVENAGRLSLRERWISGLPESILARFVHVIEPQQAHAFFETIERLYDLVLDSHDKGQGLSAFRPSLWNALLLYLATTPAAGRSPTHFLTSISESASAEDEFAIAARRLRETKFASGPERQRHSRASAPVSDVRSKPAGQRPPVSRAKAAFGLGEGDSAAGDPIYIDNAGLVLVGPFLPHFFRSLDMLVENGNRTQLREGETVSRAVHLLQYLADGRCSAPEPLLALNKILCGIAIETPVLPGIEPTVFERELCESLLTAVIARWTMVASSSVAALRETFLQREGKLVRKDDAWHLTVNRKTLDVLVDRVPWSISMLYNAWMPHPLHVTW